MIFGVGVDMFKLTRINNLEGNWDDPFFVRAFTPGERAQAQRRNKPILYYATRFAGKEAVYKAISKCGCDFRPEDIEIIDFEDGQPVVSLLGKTEEYQKNFYSGKLLLYISLTYDTDYAEAFAIAEI